MPDRDSPRRDCAVVIPTRDRGDRVIATLRSVLDGDQQPTVCVIVDQSADESTAAAVAPWATRDDVRYIRCQSSGLSAGINRGVAELDAELIALTGDDCIVDTEWLGRMISAFDDPTIGVVFGDILPGGEESAEGFYPSYEGQRDVVARGIVQKNRIAGTSANMAFRRDLWQQLEGFDESLGLGAQLRAGEDTDFTLRSLAAGVAVREVPRAQVAHLGFFEWSERPSLIQRNWFGAGAAFAKSFRRFPLGTFLAMLLGGWTWMLGRSPIALGLGKGAYRRAALDGFLGGAWVGLRTSVVPQTGHFVRGPIDPVLEDTPVGR